MRMTPLDEEQVVEILGVEAETFRDQQGFVPNSWCVMAHRPELLRAFVALMREVWAAGVTPPSLRVMVALVASAASGCRYCQAHNASRALSVGIPMEKLQAIWEFETSPLFSPGERAALKLATTAAVVPNESTHEEVAEVVRYFGTEGGVELIAVIAAFGFLNRWNETVATELESTPMDAGFQVLAESGWSPGKHAAGYERGL